GTGDALRSMFPDVRVIDPGGNVGLAGRNLGARAASGNFLLMLDDDSYPLPGAIEALVAAIDAEPRVGVVGGLVLDVADGGTVVKSTEIGTFDWWLRGRNRGPAPETGWPTFFFPEGACLIRRDAFLEVGGFFEPYFFTVSEVDLATRMLARGWDVRYVPAAVFHHMKANMGRSSPLTLEYRVRNQLWYFWMYFPGPLAVRRAVSYLAFDLVQCAYEGALPSYFRGIRRAWTEREQVRGSRSVLPRTVLRRAELNRGRMHVALLWGQLRKKLGARIASR
ncbi:MAG: glycosyltransferase family 2 protein, partial [Actinomycetota bacterium]|nr:glycosyltransferase family 2 protein [Actinomycetota bacterium]